MSEITIPKGSKPITPEELCELADRVPNDIGYVLHSDLADGFIAAAHEIQRLRKALDAATGLHIKHIKFSTPEGDLELIAEPHIGVKLIVSSLMKDLGDAENYVSMRIKSGDKSLRFQEVEVTIRRCPNGLTPAEKNTILTAELARLRKAIADAPGHKEPNLAQRHHEKLNKLPCQCKLCKWKHKALEGKEGE